MLAVDSNLYTDLRRTGPGKGKELTNDKSARLKSGEPPTVYQRHLQAKLRARHEPFERAGFDFSISIPDSLELAQPPAELEHEIARARGFVDLGENWDDAGARPINEQTWRRAATFLRATYSVGVRAGLKLPSPHITPVPDGSIDIVWKLGQKELLLNLPSNPLVPASYYGEDESGDQISKGNVHWATPSATRLFLLWLCG